MQASLKTDTESRLQRFHFSIKKGSAWCAELAINRSVRHVVLLGLAIGARDEEFNQEHLAALIELEPKRLGRVQVQVWRTRGCRSNSVKFGFGHPR